MIPQDHRELYRITRKIWLRIRRDVASTQPGQYRSIFRGNGFDWEDFREYIHGDDPRNIDWKQTARRGHAITRIMREERQQTIYLLLQNSALLTEPEHFLHHPKTRRLLELAAVFIVNAVEHADRIGLIRFDTALSPFLPPGATPRHGMRLLRELLTREPQNSEPGFTFPDAVRTLMQPRLTPGFVIMLGDFFIPDLTSHLLRSLASRHEVFAVQVTSRVERHLPPAMALRARERHGRRHFMVSAWSPRARRQYHVFAQKQIREICQRFRQSRIPLSQHDPEQPLFLQLQKFLNHYAHQHLFRPHP